MFQCIQCGLCCRKIDKVPELNDFHNGNGICKYLNNNKCSIYETRPDICNVEIMYQKEYYKYMSKKEFYEENYKVCQLLIKGGL